MRLVFIYFDIMTAERMHIPDGYLSPATCAVLYGGAAPFWYVALARLKRVLHTQVVPRIALFSAFSFIVMMFNVPLPGGTTGHAIGVGIAAIVLGLWGSIVSISVALIIQAFLFGDGGITAIGANCFNMAIVGSLVAYAAYRLISGNAAVDSSRRVAAAGIAGYLAINAAALAAAIEFGIQPALFHDAGGAPLYAPYPLSVAIPAMMLGHLTIAGLAEAIVAAGIVGYLQRTNPSLLMSTAPERRPEKPLWIALATLLLLTPLGLWYGGAAWGEWSPEDFANAETRRQIAAASSNEAPPNAAPAGLARWTGFWHAPVPRYAPEFLKNASYGYLYSAMLGTGLIVVTFSAAGWVGRRALASHSNFAFAAGYAGQAESVAAERRALQGVDPRVKLAGFFAMIVAAVASRRLEPIVILFLGGVALGMASKVPIRTLVTRVWMPALLFSGAIAIPAIFLTAGGWRSATFLVARAETAATLSALLVLTTPWPHLLKSLRTFRVPVLLVMVLGMTYRYIFSILRTAVDMLESRKSRTVGQLTPAEQRRIMVASAGVLLGKSLQMSDEVHQAMLSRGFRGEVRLLDDFRLRLEDGCWAVAFLSFSGAMLWTGR